MNRNKRVQQKAERKRQGRTPEKIIAEKNTKMKFFSFRKKEILDDGGTDRENKIEPYQFVMRVIRVAREKDKDIRTDENSHQCYAIRPPPVAVRGKHFVSFLARHFFRCRFRFRCRACQRIISGRIAWILVQQDAKLFINEWQTLRKF